MLGLRSIFEGFVSYLYIPLKCVPCHHDMARPPAANGGDGLEGWSVAVSMLNMSR